MYIQHCKSFHMFAFHCNGDSKQFTEIYDIFLFEHFSYSYIYIVLRRQNII